MKLDMRYKRFQYLMNKIHEAEKMSENKQNEINREKWSLRQEARIIVVEEGKEKIAKLEAEKVEFDKMTQMAIARARTELDGLRKQVEEEYSAKLLSIMEGRSKIGSADLSADSINEIENIIKRDTALLQKEVAEQRKYLDVSFNELEMSFNPELIKDELAKAAQKAGEPKAGEPKAGKPKAGEPKTGEPKEGEPKTGEPKAGEPKAGEPKEGEPKAGEPKAGEPKAGEPKEGEPKAGEPKEGEPKEGEPKEGEPKEGEPKGEKPPKDPTELGVEVKGLKGFLLGIVRWIRAHSKDGGTVAKWCDSMDASISASIKALPVGRGTSALPDKARAEAAKKINEAKAAKKAEKAKAAKEKKDRAWIKAKMNHPKKGDRKFMKVVNDYYNQILDELEASGKKMSSEEVDEEIAIKMQDKIFEDAKETGIDCKDKDGNDRPIKDIYGDLLKKQKAERDKGKDEEKPDAKPKDEEKKPEELARQFDKDWVIGKLKTPGDDELFGRLGAHVFNGVKKENAGREEKWTEEEVREQVLSRIEAEILHGAEAQGIAVKFRNDTRRPIQDIYKELAEKIELQRKTTEASRKAAEAKGEGGDKPKEEDKKGKYVDPGYEKY